MSRKIEYNKGDKVGNHIFLEELSPYYYPCGKKERVAKFLCSCQRETFEAKIY